MKSESHGYRPIVVVALFVLAGGILAYAQDGKLTIHVTPNKRTSSWMIMLSAKRATTTPLA